MARAVFRHLNGSKANQVEQFALDDITELTFGRDPAASVSFDADKDDLVSRRHATISVEWGDVRTSLCGALHTCSSLTGASCAG
jgi:serine protease Do